MFSDSFTGFQFRAVLRRPPFFRDSSPPGCRIFRCLVSFAIRERGFPNSRAFELAIGLLDSPPSRSGFGGLSLKLVVCRVRGGEESLERLLRREAPAADAACFEPDASYPTAAPPKKRRDMRTAWQDFCSFCEGQQRFVKHVAFHVESSGPGRVRIKLPRFSRATTRVALLRTKYLSPIFSFRRHSFQLTDLAVTDSSPEAHSRMSSKPRIDTNSSREIVDSQRRTVPTENKRTPTRWPGQGSRGGRFAQMGIFEPCCAAGPQRPRSPFTPGLKRM